MVIWDGGAGGGGAPNGQAGAWQEPTVTGPFQEIHKTIAIAMDPYATNQGCEQDEQNTYFKVNGLDKDTIGISKFYPEADTPQDPIFGSVGVLDTPETNINNYKWRVKGTWFGKFWSSRPLISDYVTKTIEVNGPVILSLVDRNEKCQVSVAAADGTTAGGGVGGQVEWVNVNDYPTLAQWGGYTQGDSCNYSHDPTSLWASDSTSHTIFGDYSNGKLGGAAGYDGEGYTYPALTINSPYGGALIATSSITARGGKAGNAVYIIGNVTITNDGTIRGEIFRQ